MRSYWKYYVLLFGLLLSAKALKADLLVLQDGRRISGFFIKEVDTIITFRDMAGEEFFIPRSKIKKLSLGYPGSPICLSQKEKGISKKKCNSLLYKIKEGKMLVAEGEGFLKLKEVPVEKVEKVEFQKADSKAKELTSSLPTGMQVELQTKQGKLRGKLQKGDGRAWNIKDKNGKLHKINKEDIAAVVLYPEKRSIFDRDLRWWHIVPGLYQYQQGQKWKGAAIGGGFGLAMLGVFVEYQASLKAAREGSSDPTVLFFYNDSYKKSFEAHQAKEKTYGLLAALIYAYHVVDYFYLGGYEASPSTTNATTGFFLEGRKETAIPLLGPSFVSPAQKTKNPSTLQAQQPASFPRIELGFRYNF